MEIGLAGWSLNRRFRAKTLELLDYPKQVKEEFGLTVIELNSPFFKSMDASYLKELKHRLNASGSRVANIAVDLREDLSATDEAVRSRAVSEYAKWFDVAAAVGSPCIRAFTGGPHEGDFREDVCQACMKSFGELASAGKKAGVKMIIENHGGVIARDPDNLVRLMKSDKSGNLGMCPDFGNFAEPVRYAGLEKVAPWAQVLHAKMHEFDAKGEEAHIDVKRCLDIFRKSGFSGPVLIEFEGKTDDHEGVLKSIALLKKYV
jgi:sugar phosphate isomerase/epimerase